MEHAGHEGSYEVGPIGIPGVVENFWSQPGFLAEVNPVTWRFSGTGSLGFIQAGTLIMLALKTCGSDDLHRRRIDRTD
jgi:hypothetical protein